MDNNDSLKKLWLDGNSQAEHYYSEIKPEIAAMAGKKSRNITRRMKRMMLFDFLGGILIVAFLGIILPAEKMHTAPLWGKITALTLLLFLFILYSIYSFNFLKKTKEAENEDDIILSLKVKIKLLSRYVKIGNTAIYAAPFLGFFVAFCLDPHFSDWEWKYLPLALVLIFCLWVFAKVAKSLNKIFFYGRYLERLRATLAGLEENEKGSETEEIYTQEACS